RALAVMAGMALDQAKYGEGETKRAQRRVDLLVPLCKAFFTDTGLESTIHAQQVFGGHGYIRETGVEQLVRDVRIAQIYEGTNGIQALDLLQRKVLPKQGEALQELHTEVTELIQQLPPQYQAWGQVVDRAFAELQEVAMTLANHEQQADAVSSAAVDYLHAMGYATYGYLWLKMLHALPSASMNEDFKTRKLAIAAFYFARLMPRFHMHIASALAPVQATMGLDNSDF
ncbi:MAG: acyl-CoA dehydrogenase C-terminal domain-containing protein, partial [Ferrimonas sp.]